jgi:hypothetical protein
MWNMTKNMSDKFETILSKWIRSIQTFNFLLKRQTYVLMIQTNVILLYDFCYLEFYIEPV